MRKDASCSKWILKRANSSEDKWLRGGVCSGAEEASLLSFSGLQEGKILEGDLCPEDWNTARNPDACQSPPISVLWGSDRRDGSRNRGQRSQVTETGTFPNSGTWGRGLGQTASQMAQGGLRKQNKPFHTKVTISLSHNSRTWPLAFCSFCLFSDHNAVTDQAASTLRSPFLQSSTSVWGRTTNASFLAAATQPAPNTGCPEKCYLWENY